MQVSNTMLSKLNGVAPLVRDSPSGNSNTMLNALYVIDRPGVAGLS